eukprot:GEMP01103664.1.p1 GENE.GEMP01103664.1~~GEMP01103664.1.p1  ORF type:complete len:128 (+),score=5.96 GEMP01103664.1:222-605(+)
MCVVPILVTHVVGMFLRDKGRVYRVFVVAELPLRLEAIKLDVPNVAGLDPFIALFHVGFTKNTSIFASPCLRILSKIFFAYLFISVRFSFLRCVCAFFGIVCSVSRIRNINAQQMRYLVFFVCTAVK